MPDGLMSNYRVYKHTISEARRNRIEQLELDGHRDQKTIAVLYYLAERADEFENLINSATSRADYVARRRDFGVADELFNNACSAVYEGEVK